MMRRFRFALLLVLAGSLALPGRGQTGDSTRGRPWLRRLVPHHAKAQFAGSIGWLSASAGYGFWRRKLEMDFYGGFVPRHYNGDLRSLSTFSLKLTYWPWQIPIRERTIASPFSFGLWGSVTPGENLELFWPDYYPTLYYWAPTGVRVGGFVGGRIERLLPASGRVKGIGAYYELGTNDLLAATWFNNRRSVSPGSILHLALGVQLRFR